MDKPGADTQECLSLIHILIVPDRPGIGIELADDAAEKFPANDRANHTAHMAFDGSVRDW